MPNSFTPSEFFDEYYGVIINGEQAVEKINLKVSARQANYLRSLPLHHSQQEIERTTECSIFQLTLCPTYDFQQEILRNCEDIEVLEPSWLRTEIADNIKKMYEKYHMRNFDKSF